MSANPQLPIEIKRNILSFIKPKEMQNVKLVSRAFYRFCCELSSFSFPLEISCETLSDTATVDMLKNTFLRFDFLHVAMKPFMFQHHCNFKEILAVHGEFITSAYFGKSSFGSLSVNFLLFQSSITQWLNLMPNLKNLSFEGFWSITNHMDDEQRPFNLPNLEHIIYPPFSVINKLHLMPKSSIISMELICRMSIPNLQLVFEKHAETLKRIEFISTFPSENALIFRSLQLETFVLHCSVTNHPREVTLIDIIEHQQGLKELCLGQIESSECYFVTSRLMLTISYLKDLKKLELGIDVDVDLTPFSRMTNLKNLVIEFQNREQIDEFCKIPLPALKSLKMGQSISLSGLKDIGKSLPNIENFSGGVIQATTFNEIFENMPKLVRLSLKESNYGFVDTGAIYPHMKRLDMWCNDFRSDSIFTMPVDLIKAMPNLEEIHIGRMVGDGDVLQALLESKIKRIKIGMPFRNISNIKRLRKLKNKLKKKCMNACDIILML